MTNSPADWKRVLVLVGANALSLAGDFVLLVALSWTAVRVGGAGAVTTLVLAQTIPRAVMLVFGGAVTDAFGPRFVVLRTTAARAVVLSAGTAAVLTVHGFWPLVVIAVLEGVFLGLSSPSSSIMMAKLATGELGRANSLYGTVLRIAPIVGAPVGAWLIAVGKLWESTAVVATVCAVVFGCMLYISSGMGRPERTRSENLVRGSGNGFRLLAAEPRLRWLFVSAFCLDLAFGWPLEVALPLLANQRAWGVGAVGTVVAAFSAGALGSGALGALLAHRIPLSIRLTVSGVAIGVGIILMALVPTVTALLVVSFLVGTMCGLNGPAIVTAYQQAAPPARMGAAMSTLALSAVGTGPVSIACFSSLAVVLGVRGSWLVCGVVAFVGPLAAMRALRARPAAPTPTVGEVSGSEKTREPAMATG